MVIRGYSFYTIIFPLVFESVLDIPSFPPEILDLIFQLLPTKHLVFLQLVCKSFYAISKPLSRGRVFRQPAETRGLERAWGETRTTWPNSAKQVR